MRSQSRHANLHVGSGPRLERTVVGRINSPGPQEPHPRSPPQPHTTLLSLHSPLLSRHTDGASLSPLPFSRLWPRRLLYHRSLSYRALHARNQLAATSIPPKSRIPLLTVLAQGRPLHCCIGTDCLPDPVIRVPTCTGPITGTRAPIQTPNSHRRSRLISVDVAHSISACRPTPPSIHTCCSFPERRLFQHGNPALDRDCHSATRTLPAARLPQVDAVLAHRLCLEHAYECLAHIAAHHKSAAAATPGHLPAPHRHRNTSSTEENREAQQQVSAEARLWCRLPQQRLASQRWHPPTCNRRPRDTRFAGWQ
jgi:hypothetical protein